MLRTSPYRAAMLATAISFAVWSPAFAASLRNLYSFCAKSVCADGNVPNDLTIGASGQLYGSTSGGGTHTWGTVFELSFDPVADRWKHQVLHNFCAKQGCTDGGNPNGGLILDAAGNLYGTTYVGGGNGSVYELSPPAAGKTVWTEKVLYAFCALPGCADGSAPQTGLTYAGASSGQLYDGHSALFGTTQSGGATLHGAVFEIAPAEPGKKWTESAIYSFCPTTDCNDGVSLAIVGNLAMDAAGNLFGTTRNGGVNKEGVAFELTPGIGGWTQTVIYSFCARTSCADGFAPQANMTLDSAGVLWGTTMGGGRNTAGVLFKLVRIGATWQYSVVYNFCARKFCVDGALPQAGLTLDGHGNVFGTASEGGYQDNGTVFEWNGALQVLHKFCMKPSCPDGRFPKAAPAMDAAGNLYGTTSDGAAHGHGTAFEVFR